MLTLWRRHTETAHIAIWPREWAPTAVHVARCAESFTNRD